MPAPLDSPLAAFLFAPLPTPVPQSDRRVHHRNHCGMPHRIRPQIAWDLESTLNRDVTDGPAYEGTDGRKSWYLDGSRHREDGPAIEYANGVKKWFLNGKLYSEDNFKYEMQKRELSQSLQVNLTAKQKGITVKI